MDNYGDSFLNILIYLHALNIYLYLNFFPPMYTSLGVL